MLTFNSYFQDTVQLCCYVVLHVRSHFEIHQCGHVSLSTFSKMADRSRQQRLCSSLFLDVGVVIPSHPRLMELSLLHHLWHLLLFSVSINFSCPLGSVKVQAPSTTGTE